MVGKVSERVLLREGLERTDNGMKQTIWPDVPPINQKNYYTDYMKRDDQILALRPLNDPARDRMASAAKERDRVRMTTTEDGQDGPEVEAKDEEDEETAATDEEEEDDVDDPARIIVIHPGSQNLRIGFAADALPRTVPMVLAHRAVQTESEFHEALPRRNFEEATTERQFGEEWSRRFKKMSEDLKVEMRAHKHKVLPNSKELVVNYNRRTEPETISVHNDPYQVEWTDVSKEETFFGNEAMRIPDNSDPKFRLWWPIQHGWLNEDEYGTIENLHDDLELVLEKAIKIELGIKNIAQLKNYSCVFIIPDLYDKKYVEQVLHSCLTWFEFKRVCFIQESMAATFGAGYTQACVIDVGAQKTSITCVEDGLCLEDSRINLKYGGWDVTETFIRMILFDNFPYESINLRHRYDFLLAEELKFKHCSLAQNLVSVQLITFHVRAPGKETEKYQAKIYDEAYLACTGFYEPAIFDNSAKLCGRRNLIDMSFNSYESDCPDDPQSAAQLQILTLTKPSLKLTISAPSTAAAVSNGFNTNGVSTPVKDRATPINFLSKVNEGLIETPSGSSAPSPGPDGSSTPVPATYLFNRDTATGSPAPGSARTDTPGPAIPEIPTRTAESIAQERDTVLPVAPLDAAVMTSIQHASRGDEKKLRDFMGAVMVVGGGAKIPLFANVLEERLRRLRPDVAEKILVSRSARDMDEQVVMWKGASVFAKLGTNDSWISGFEYERLGSRILHHKVLWSW